MNQLPTAVFLDRDGTIIEDVHYLAHPDQVRLMPGAAESIARINALLIPVIVVTNQSGIARGKLTVADHELITARLDQMLAEAGARIDATYYCPHGPDDGCECRKPGTLLFRNAQDEHPEIDLSSALYVGDKFRDIEPGLLLGGHAVLVASPDTSKEDREAAQSQARVAPSLGTALDWYLCSN